MSQIVVFSTIFALLTFASSSWSQERSPHGLGFVNPVAFSPSAYDFFHPDAGQPGSTENSCSKSGCSAAHFESIQGHESRASLSQRHRHLGAGAIAAIVSGLVFAVLLGMGAYYVATTRRANTNRANSNQPDV